MAGLECGLRFRKEGLEKENNVHYLKGASRSAGQEELAGLISKLQDFHSKLSAPFVEKEEEAKLITLGLVCYENVLFVGPPGTAKSDIALMAARLIEDAKFFKSQLHVYTEPPQLFGHIDIRKLRRRFRKPTYEHVTTGKLPESDIAFIDEIFRGGKIRDTLLSIMNEHAMFNGKEVVKVPIRSIISATNFVSDEEEDQAMKDRFILRKFVMPVSSSPEAQSKLLHAAFEGEFSSSKEVRNPVLSLSDIDKLYGAIAKMDVFRLEDQLIEIFASRIRDIEISISDRTKGKVLKLAAANALLNGRDHVLFEDLMVLKYVLPNDEDELKKVEGMLEDTLSPKAYQKQIADLKNNLEVLRSSLSAEVPLVRDDVLKMTPMAISTFKRKARIFIEMTPAKKEAQELLRSAEGLEGVYQKALERKQNYAARRTETESAEAAA